MKHRHTIPAALVLAGNASNSPSEVKHVAGSAKIATIEGRRMASARFVSGVGYSDMYNVDSRTPSYIGNHPSPSTITP